MRWLGLIAVLSLLPSSPAAAKEYPIQVTIFDFTLSGRFDRVRITDLKEEPLFSVHPDGTTKRQVYYRQTHEQVRVQYQFPWPENPGAAFFRDLQARSLKVMLDQQYISQKLYDDVIDDADLWKPGQVRFIVTWSELTLAEANKLFNGEIPWDRVMDDPFKKKNETDLENDKRKYWEWETLQKPGTKLRISRSSIMLGLGFRHDFEAKRLEFPPMAWQNIEAFQAVSNLPPEMFPLRLEFSRAVSERAPLAGDLKLPLRIALKMAKETARLHQVPLHRFGIFARALKEDRGIGFLRMFDSRIWDKDLHGWFLRDPEDASHSFTRLPRPRKVNEEAVLVSTLKVLSEQLSVDGLSARDHEIWRRLKGKVDLAKAQELHENLLDKVWTYYDFPEFVETRGPVCVLDNSVFPPAFVVPELVGLGLSEDEASVFVHWVREQKYTDLNLYSEFWVERGYVLPKSNSTQSEALNQGVGIQIQNLSTEAALKHPDYLPRVLMGIYADILNKLAAARPETLSTIAATLHTHQLVRANQQGAFELTEETIFGLSPFLFHTTSPQVRDQLVALGGTAFAADLLGLPETAGQFLPSAQLLLSGQAWIVRFDGAQLHFLHQRFRLAAGPVGCAEVVRLAAKTHRALNFSR